MDRYRTLRASLLATALTVSLTSGVYAQTDQSPRDYLSPGSSVALDPLIIQQLGAREVVPLGSRWTPSNSSSDVPSDRIPDLIPPNVPPDQMGSPSDVPNIQLPPIPFDSTSILSAPDIAGFLGTGSTLGAKGDVFNGKVVGQDDGILLKGRIGEWDHDLDPGILWHGTADSLVVIAHSLDSLVRSNGTFSIHEGDVGGSFSIGENGILTTDSVVNGGSFSNGAITSGSITIGDTFGLGGQKHDHYYLKDGNRYYMQYASPDPKPLKMEERVGTSDIWLIGESNATPKK